VVTDPAKVLRGLSERVSRSALNRTIRLLVTGLAVVVATGLLLMTTLANRTAAQPTTSSSAPAQSPNPSETLPPSTSTSGPATTAPANTTGATQPAAAPLPAANPGHGQALYVQQCLICHDVDAEGDGPVHTLFVPEPANLTAVKDAPDMAFSIFQNGLLGTAMPAHRNLSRADFNDIIAYLETMPLDTTRQWSNAWSIVKEPNPALAQSIYAQACADCHGTSGKGDGPWVSASPYVWPRPADFTARSSDLGRVFDTITNGIPGTFMAPQAPKFTEAARYALALYVLGFLDPTSKDTIATGSVGDRTDPYSADNAPVWLDGQNESRLYCEYCHGGEVNGTLIAPDLTDRTWRYGGGTDAALFEVIQKGIPGKLMPPHAVLSEDMRWRIITFIRHRGGLPDPLKASKTSGNPSTLGGASNTSTSGSSSAGSSTLSGQPGVLTFGSTAAQGLALTRDYSSTVYVDIKDLSFQPANLVVAPGTRVIWTNRDDTLHTTTMNDWDPAKSKADQPPGAWDSAELSPGESFSAVFSQPGTSMYLCLIHPTMIGSISVDVSMIGAYSPIGRAGIHLGWWWAAIGVAIAIAALLVFRLVIWGRFLGPGSGRAGSPPTSEA
jgi:plastocyanin/mono/diheme cytochrome c family protein